MADDAIPRSMENIEFDGTNLYREDQITDLKVGSIQRMIPIKDDGTDDPDRAVIYTANAQMMSQMGPLPIQSPIEATSLKEAIAKYPDAIQQGVSELMEEVQKRQRDEASKIVTPGARGGGGLGGADPNSNLIL